MKSFVAAIFAAAIPAAIHASPVARDAPEKFTLMSIRSGDINLHLRPINANSGYFYIGRDTMSSCPIEGADCPAGNATVLQSSSETSVRLSTAAPGVQEVYVEATHGSIPGALAYNVPHGSPPATGILEGFSVDDSRFSFAGASWVACPTQGAYIVQTIPTGGEVPEFCEEIAIRTVPWTEGAGAWQYDISQ